MPSLFDNLSILKLRGPTSPSPETSTKAALELVLITAILLLLFGNRHTVLFLAFSLVLIFILYVLQKKINMSVEYFTARPKPGENQFAYPSGVHNWYSYQRAPVQELPPTYSQVNPAEKRQLIASSTYQSGVTQSVADFSNAAKFESPGQMLMNAGRRPGRPEAYEPPVVSAPMFSDFWRPPTSTVTGLNSESIQDVYGSGYMVTTPNTPPPCPREPPRGGAPEATLSQRLPTSRPLLPPSNGGAPPVIERKVVPASSRPSTDIPRTRSTTSSRYSSGYAKLGGSTRENYESKCQSGKQDKIVLDPTRRYPNPQDATREEAMKESSTNPIIQAPQVNAPTETPTDSHGKVIKASYYDANNAAFGGITNYRPPVGYEEDRARNVNLSTNTSQPGSYYKSDIIEPPMSNLGISFAPGQRVTRVEDLPDEFGNTGTKTRHVTTNLDPGVSGMVPRPAPLGPATQAGPQDVYSGLAIGSGCSSYGDNRRMYIHEITGQPRWVYTDVNAARMPTMIGRNSLPIGVGPAPYGTPQDGEGFGVSAVQVRADAQQAYVANQNGMANYIGDALSAKYAGRYVQRRDMPVCGNA